MALIVIGLYVLIQQLENHLLVPKIMEKAAGVTPVMSIISILVCYQLFGPIGVLIGVPIASLLVAAAETFVGESCISSIES